MKANFLKNYHNQCSIYINPKMKWVWLRIHKNAGTSTLSALNGMYWNDPKNCQEKAIRWIKEITDEELEHYFFWSVVRNPYDRFVSTARMFDIPPNRFAKEFEFFTHKKGIIKRHSIPQHKYLCIDGKNICHYTIKFENMKEQFRLLSFILDQEIKLPHLNRTVRKDWKSELNRKTLDFINIHYREDFNIFDYEMI